MRSQFQEILEAVRNGQSASYQFQADGEDYIRSFQPRERLILLGGGHIAQPLCRYAADLGFAVTVADDRAEFASTGRFPEAEHVICDTFPNALEALRVNERDYVAVITRGHQYDADCLRILLKGPFPKYLGMIGSRHRVAGLFRVLEEEGYARSDLERIHSPIGLSINALTVKEIAVSILAELIACKRQGTSRRARGTLLVAEDIDLPLLEALAEGDAPAALITVYETSGSSPVKSGAMMMVDKFLRTAGTIGGGCGEGGVLLEARRIIGTGEKRCVTVDLSNDVAADEGMVCGGEMKVLIEDLG